MGGAGDGLCVGVVLCVVVAVGVAGDGLCVGGVLRVVVAVGVAGSHLYGLYQDAASVTLVLEYLAGGELSLLPSRGFARCDRYSPRRYNSGQL